MGLAWFGDSWYSGWTVFGTHLRLGDDGAVLGGRPEEGGQRGGDDEGAGPHEAAQVAAGDVVLLLLHHQGVHHVEDVPGDPHGAVLGEEGRALETQGEGGSAVSQQVEPRPRKTLRFTLWVSLPHPQLEFALVQPGEDSHFRLKYERMEFPSGVGPR